MRQAVSLAQSFKGLEMFRSRERPAVFECVHDRMSVSQEFGILSWKNFGGTHRIRGSWWQEVQDERVIGARMTEQLQHCVGYVTLGVMTNGDGIRSNLPIFQRDHAGRCASMCLGWEGLSVFCIALSAIRVFCGTRIGASSASISGNNLKCAAFRMAVTSALSRQF